MLALCLLLCSCAAPGQVDCADAHVDQGNDGLCDQCGENVLVSLNFYTINDLHGKIADADTHPGVDELTTYLKNARQTKDNVILLSAGDMWQGSSESNLTNGLLMTDWMNQVRVVQVQNGHGLIIHQLI